MDFAAGNKRSKATTEEWGAIHRVRLSALAEATRETPTSEPLPVDERAGWTSTVRNLGRAYDGSLRLVVTVRDPEGSIKLRKKVRLHREEASTTG